MPINTIPTEKMVEDINVLNKWSPVVSISNIHSVHDRNVKHETNLHFLINCT